MPGPRPGDEGAGALFELDVSHCPVTSYYIFPNINFLVHIKLIIFMFTLVSQYAYMAL